MSDDFHRPTYTSADRSNYPTNDEGRYNPTQVRLYGIPGMDGIIWAGAGSSISSSGKWDTINIDLSDP
jgi:hypothetical protein